MPPAPSAPQSAPPSSPQRGRLPRLVNRAVSCIGAGTILAALAVTLGTPTPAASTTSPDTADSAELTNRAVAETPARDTDRRVSAPATSGRLSARVTAAYARTILTSSRTAVEAAYRTRYAPYLAQPTGYRGNAARCEPGSQSSASRAGTLSALNFVRALGGLAPVSFTRTLNARSQATAILMSANNQLSHFPSSNWNCYTRTGAANAARSNLALSYPNITSGTAVGLYMQEPGANNTAVGHRRWLMNPQAVTMGSGATQNANSITVMGATNAWRPNPAYVGWPTAGYFPASLEPDGRWSLSAGHSGTNFSRATVHVAHLQAGRWLGVAVHQHRVQNGYARPTLVWEMPAVSAHGTYRVTVTGIRRAGTSRSFAKTYVVRLFTPRAG